MGKGLAQRRRLKRALEAARGNLHKIANGKSLPRGHGLPEAPKPEDANQLPRSLRKILAVKEALQAKEGKAAAAPEAPREWKRKDKGRQREAGAQAGDGPSTSGRPDSEGGSAAEWKKNTKQQQGGEQQEQQQHKGGAKGLQGAKGNPFLEQAASKSLKTKKKEYLKRKAEGKRKRGGKEELVVEKELQLRDKVKFGEVVDAPLQVHLKRKHWAGQEKSASERCKEVFLKQMQQAQQRMEPAAGGPAGPAGPGAGRQLRDEGVAVGGPAAGAPKKAGKKDAGGKGQAKQQQQQQQQDKKGKKRKAPMDEETEALRQQLIESYRMAKKGGSVHTASVGNATLASLAKLTGKGKAAAAAGTYTLA